MHTWMPRVKVSRGQSLRTRTRGRILNPTALPIFMVSLLASGWPEYLMRTNLAAPSTLEPPRIVTIAWRDIWMITLLL